MPTPIHVNPGFRSHRREMRGAMERVLPHRRSYLSFMLGFLATVIIALAVLGWWLLQSGIVSIQINV